MTKSQIEGLVAATLLLSLSSSASAQERPLSLERSLELGRRNNGDVRQSQLEIDAAEQTRKAAFTHYFPQVFATGLLMYAYDPFVKVGIPGGNLPVFNGNPASLLTATQFAYMPSSTMGTGNRMSFLSLTAVQPVFAGGRIYAGNQLAALGVDAARTQAAMKHRDTGAQTEEKYWRVVVLKEKVRTLAAYDALLGSLQKKVDDFAGAGMLTRNDQLKVSLQRSQVSVDSERLQSGIRLASRDLRRHLGLSDSDSVELADSLPAPEDPTPLRGKGQEGQSQRPELQLLQHAARAEELKVSMTRGEMLPSFSVGGSVFRMDIDGLGAQTNAVAFGVVNVPLSAIWTGVHETKAQAQRAEVARLRLAETRKLIGLDVTKSWDELWTAWQVTKVSELAVLQSEVNLREVTDRHDHGLVTFSDVLEAQALRQQAIDKQIDARSEYRLKRAAYLRAVGQGTP